MISKDKQYRTRDGREVRIYATDGCGMYCIHGAVENWDGWDYETWDNNGKWNEDEESDFDLIEIRPRIRRDYWVNLYPNNERSALFTNKVEANSVARVNRIACARVFIDCEEGEGL